MPEQWFRKNVNDKNSANEKDFPGGCTVFTHKRVCARESTHTHTHHSALYTFLPLFKKKSTLELEIYRPAWGFRQPAVPMKMRGTQCQPELIRPGEPTPVAGTGDCCSRFPGT